MGSYRLPSAVLIQAKKAGLPVFSATSKLPIWVVQSKLPSAPMRLTEAQAFQGLMRHAESSSTEERVEHPQHLP